jgi:hypothetical protein
MDVLDAKKIQQKKRRICAQTVIQREPDLKKLTCTSLDCCKKDNVIILETKINDKNG